MPVRAPTGGPRLTLIPRIAAIALMALAMSVAALRQGHAQSAPCHVVCAPTVALMPGAVRTHVLHAPRVRDAGGAPVHALPGTWNGEMIVAVASRTALPRLGVFGSVQWLPNASTARNPFTLYTADALGTHVRANAPTLVVGGSLALVTPEATRGWLDLAANVGDLFSQAARPDDRASYTHKLDLDLVTHLHAFAWAPPRTYLRRMSAYAILDYVATGLPRAGDEVPVGREFVSSARPAALVLGLVLPITPSTR